MTGQASTISRAGRWSQHTRFPALGVAGDDVERQVIQGAEMTLAVGALRYVRLARFFFRQLRWSRVGHDTFPHCSFVKKNAREPIC